MTTKNLVILGAVAAVLGGAAYFCNSGRKMKAPALNGKPVLPAFDVSAISRIEIGGCNLPRARGRLCGLSRTPSPAHGRAPRSRRR